MAAFSESPHVSINLVFSHQEIVHFFFGH